MEQIAPRWLHVLLAADMERKSAEERMRQLGEVMATSMDELNLRIRHLVRTSLGDLCNGPDAPV
jgi:hypothetical protein